MCQPTITITVRRYNLLERIAGAWYLLFCDWGREKSS